jgi:hypothetical protein
MGGRAVVTVEQKRRWIWILLLSLLLLLPCPKAASVEHADELPSCSEFYEALDNFVQEAGVYNASSFPVPGYPFLRTTRFLEEMRYYVSDREEKEQWFDLLFQEGKQAVVKEIANIPEERLEEFAFRQGIPSTPSGEIHLAVQKRARQCGRVLLGRARNDPRFSILLSHVGEIPSEYKKERKVFGLYPLMTLPVGMFISRYRHAVSRQYDIPLEQLTPKGILIYFSPEGPPPSQLDGASPVELQEKSAANPLGIPLPDEETLFRLVRYYAPILVQDITGNYDRLGTLEWEGDRVSVNPEKPAVYYFAGHSLLRGIPLLQLNYVLWYSQRPKVHWIDIEAGRIHAMTIRLTLNRDGEPIMLDLIHNCGCYHFFYPSHKVFRKARTELLREDAFVPQWLPSYRPDQRIALRIGTKKHFAERVFYPEGKLPPSTRYKLVPYDRLESLPRDSGEKESVFTPEGILKGETQRPERFLLYPVGIKEIGSMRQRGHQATSLIGERYFDDPRLFEKFFFLR